MATRPGLLPLDVRDGRHAAPADRLQSARGAQTAFGPIVRSTHTLNTSAVGYNTRTSSREVKYSIDLS